MYSANHGNSGGRLSASGKKVKGYHLHFLSPPIPTVQLPWIDSRCNTGNTKALRTTMKAVKVTAGLYKPKNLNIVRSFQTANQKQVQAAAVLDATDEKSEWDKAKPFSTIPGPKPLPLPRIGNIWRLLPIFSNWSKDMVQMYQDLYQQYGPIIKLVGLGRENMTILYDPVDVEKMFRNESIWPQRTGLDCLKYYRTVIRKDFYKDTEGLITSQGEKWQTFRTATNQTMMQPKNVIMYLDSVAAVLDDFIERIRYIRKPNEEMPDDFLNELNKMALESFAVISLDTRLGCLANDLSPDSDAMKMTHNVRDVLHLMYKLEFEPSIWKLISTPTWRKFVKEMDEILEITVKYTYIKWEEIKKQNENESKENKSILETLLLKTKDPKIPIVMTTDTLFAGIDTTSNTTATFLYHLAINPEKQEKLFQELKTHLPKKDSKITKEVLNELKYAKAVLKESMRVKPTVSVNQRTLEKDLVLKGYQIPKGTQLIAAHQVMCLMDTYFKDPLKFIPERWLKSESKSEISSKNTNPFVFLPFGFGQRSCIGKRFAYLEMELALAKIIRNFKVSYHHEPMTWNSRLVTSPSKPLRFKMTERPE